MSSSSLCFSPPRRKLTQPLTEANLDVVCGLLDLYMSRIFMVLFCFGKGNTGNHPPPPKKKRKLSSKDSRCINLVCLLTNEQDYPKSCQLGYTGTAY